MSVARTAVVPLQDLLELPTEARMNLPGSAFGNWGWRYRAGLLTPELAAHYKTLNRRYGRC